jgi:ABC-type nitrate/sulfonate/bicarbonate transport system permease component
MKSNIKIFFSIVILVILWQIIISLNLVSTLFFTSPFKIIISLYELIIEDSILVDVLLTFWRTFLAFILSVIIGTPIGMMIGYYKVGINLEIFVDFFRSIPPIALFPLFLFFFGIGDLSKIAVASFGGSMVIIVASIYGIRRINKNRLNLARKMGIKGRKLFTRVLLPDSLDNIFSGYRLAVSLCIILIIVTEMFLGGAKYGLGKRIIDAQMLYNIPELYALIFILGLMGYVLNKSFIIMENKIIHWRGN